MNIRMSMIIESDVKNTSIKSRANRIVIDENNEIIPCLSNSNEFKLFPICMHIILGILYIIYNDDICNILYKKVDKYITLVSVNIDGYRIVNYGLCDINNIYITVCSKIHIGELTDIRTSLGKRLYIKLLFNRHSYKHLPKDVYMNVLRLYLLYNYYKIIADDYGVSSRTIKNKVNEYRNNNDKFCLAVDLQQVIENQHV